MKSIFAIALAAAGLTSALTTINLSPDADVNVVTNFGPEHETALISLFSTIERIPDDVLLAGDRATEQWLVDAGIASPEVLDSLPAAEKREEPAAPVAESTLWDRAVAPAASIWKIAKCVASIIELLATTAIPAARLAKIKKLIKELGGTKDAVELMLKASTKKERLRVGGEALVALAAEISGIASVKRNCF